MKILFQRRSISYSITKSEVTRVMRGEELDNIFETVFLVRILDGHPTLLLEPTNLFPEINMPQFHPGQNQTIFLFCNEMAMREELFLLTLLTGD